MKEKLQEIPAQDAKEERMFDLHRNEKNISLYYGKKITVDNSRITPERGQISKPINHISNPSLIFAKKKKKWSTQWGGASA